MNKGFKISTFGFAACAVLTTTSAFADTNYHPLLSLGSLLQDWSNAALITTNDDWSLVPSITGYLGDLPLTTTTGVDPQTHLSASLSVSVDAIANQTNPNTLTSGGVGEFDTLANPTVALQGSGTADAPNLVLFLDLTGMEQVTVSYVLRDIDGGTDNAVQAVALQYRVGITGDFINLPAYYVADASTGPSLATAITSINAALPVDVDNQSQVQVRIISSNAPSNDEWIGVDDINVSGIVSVPEPSAFLSVISGLGMLGMLRRRSR